MKEKTVDWETAVERIAKWVNVNPTFTIEDGAVILTIIFDALGKAETANEFGLTAPLLDYETGFERMMCWMKINPNFALDDAVEALSVVFSVPAWEPREEIKARIELNV